MPDPASPRVSIGFTSYNDGRFAREAIESLLAQDFTDFELILSDDNSTDGTGDICGQYAERDKRVRLFRQPSRLGIIDHQNFVFRQARAPFFMWAAGHDLWRPNYISQLLPVLESNPAVVCAYPLIPVIDTDGKVISDPRFNAWMDTRALNVVSRLNIMLWSSSGCNQIGGLFRADALRRTRMYHHVISPDNLLIFELSLIGAIACVHEDLMYFRKTKPSAHLRDVLERYKTTFYPATCPKPKYFRMWMTHWRQFFDHLTAVLRSPHSIRRKPVMLASVAFFFLARRTKHMFHDILQALGFRRP
ncbi:MAG: hypothetical protein A3G34_09510 [Candidatus Lindowbacteria bacterium RIFCSPLOWO2_12_FULL_62_27]|nr:MAG: hypothetical protein A3I06_08170 [Candidatus Lindowbacteria bacterium RIFCSPLOWO2_02_FULL_62_12]OGH60273.1 MAG: hypothetical protein A3G34_09510 [Candidatus Lindowbacteria bacterium RIFCSPLOWO2_12_FULL_62_27]